MTDEGFQLFFDDDRNDGVSPELIQIVLPPQQPPLNNYFDLCQCYSINVSNDASVSSSASSRDGVSEDGTCYSTYDYRALHIPSISATMADSREDALTKICIRTNVHNSQLESVQIVKEKNNDGNLQHALTPVLDATTELRDIVPGKYLGGLKVWSCAMDLAAVASCAVTRCHSLAMSLTQNESSTDAIKNSCHGSGCGANHSSRCAVASILATKWLARHRQETKQCVVAKDIPHTHTLNTYGAALHLRVIELGCGHGVGGLGIVGCVRRLGRHHSMTCNGAQGRHREQSTTRDAESSDECSTSPLVGFPFFDVTFHDFNREVVEDCTRPNVYRTWCSRQQQQQRRKNDDEKNNEFTVLNSKIKPYEAVAINHNFVTMMRTRFAWGAWKDFAPTIRHEDCHFLQTTFVSSPHVNHANEGEKCRLDQQQAKDGQTSMLGAFRVHYDTVLASDCTYDDESAEELIKCCARILRPANVAHDTQNNPFNCHTNNDPGGLAIICTKRYYFGTGGGEPAIERSVASLRGLLKIIYAGDVVTDDLLSTEEAKKNNNAATDSMPRRILVLERSSIPLEDGG